MAQNPRVIVERWLANKLGTLSTPVNRHPAPDQTPYPNITIDLLTGTAGGPMRNLAQVQTLTYRVNVYDKGLDSTKVNKLAKQIVEALDIDTPETVSWTEDGENYKGVINSCSYMGIIPISVETEGDQVYQRDGSDWVIQVLCY